MDSNSSSGGMSTLVERFGVTKRDKSHRDKDHRLSKADIGGPISTTEKADGNENQLGAPVLILRCVIVHKDENGYGLTVSGDNPVYVQSIKEDGAAYKAGVREGDRIVNVNGTRVTEYNHIEVVKLIKSGVFVNLTLLGKPLGPGEAGGTVNQSTQNMTSNVSQPAASNEDTFFNEKVATIKKMLKQESSEVERIKEEYAKQPNSRLLNKLRVAQKLKQDLEKQLWKAESNHQNQIDMVNIQAGGQDSSSPDHDTNPGDLEGITVYDSEEILDQSEKHNLSDAKSPEGHTDTMHGTDDSHVLTNNTNAEDNLQNPNIMNFEEDDLAGESEAFRDHGPFNDFEKLRTKQAHMAVFIKYVFTHHDPCSLLLILAVDGFKALTSNKEMLKTADNICKTYILPSAVLKVKVDDGIAKSINDTIHAKNLPDDTVRTVFNPAVQPCLKIVQSQLKDFCMKREQGLGSLFGEEKLQLATDHAHEIKVVEDVITNLIQDLTGSVHTPESADVAKAEALNTHLSQVMGKRKSKISKIGSMLRPRTQNSQISKNRISGTGSMESIVDEPNKRSSMFINKGKRKPKTGKEGAIIPVVQTSHPTLVHPENDGMVSQMVNKFQDGTVDNNSNLSASDNHKRGTGSFQKFEDKRSRSTTGKSNSDPDAHSVEKVVSEHSQSTDSIDQSNLSTSSSFSTALGDEITLPYDTSDEELQVESESTWSAGKPTKLTKQLGTKEIKRQEIIFELLQTERHHVRDLKILYLLFYERMLTENVLTQAELDLVFPNLVEILKMHRKLNTMFQKLKKGSGDVIQYIGDTLLARFDSVEGKKFKEECAKYCGNQSFCLDFIKQRCKKDQKFNHFIRETERFPIFRRLQLKDFIPMEFQRLTKYPLLLDNIAKNTKKKDEEEASKIKRASAQCKVTLSYVNKAVKDAEDHQKIVEIQNNLDASPLQKVSHPIVNEYKNINLLERTLIHQGPLVWKLNQTDKKKYIDLHCVVFDDVVVLLQRQDEKYVLKCHNTGPTSNSLKGDEKALVHPPILKLSKVLVRNVATDKKAFFIVSTSELGPQMYELVAKTQAQMQEWIHLINETAELARKKEAQHKRREGFSVPESSRVDKLRKRQASNEAAAIKPRDVMDAPKQIEPEDEVGIKTLEEILKPPTEEIGILERIQHKHEEIVAAVTFKHKLLAEHAGLDDGKLDEVLDMALTDSEPDPAALVMHSLLHADKLTTMINDLMQPDTVFLQPPQTVLHPQESASSSSSNTATPDHSAQPEDREPRTEEEPVQITEQQLDIVEEAEEEVSEQPLEESSAQEKPEEDNPVEEAEVEKVEKWAEMVVHPASEDEQESIKEEEQVEEDTNKLTSPINTPDRRSTASLELVMSDYETASETASSPAPNQSEVNSYSDDNQPSDNTTTASALPTDTGIDTQDADDDDAASDNTLSAIDPEFEQTASSSLVGDLLSFEPAIVPPDLDGSTTPLSPNTEHLMAKTEPIRLGKMLEITCNLQAQLTQLLRAVKVSESERQRLVEENERLSSSLSEFQQTSSQVNETSTDEVSQASPPEYNAESNTTNETEHNDQSTTAESVANDDTPTNNIENEQVETTASDMPPTYASVVSGR